MLSKKRTPHHLGNLQIIDFCDSHTCCPLTLDPDPPRILSVEYLSRSRAKITWKATKCNFDRVRRIRIQQAGSGVVLNGTTNWDNVTEVGYQIVENITLIEGESYLWNISVLYGEGYDQAWSASSEVFEAVVIGKLLHG